LGGVTLSSLGECELAAHTPRPGFRTLHLLTSSPQGATTYVQADLRDPDKILQGAAETLDFTQPVAITLLIHRQVLLSPV